MGNTYANYTSVYVPDLIFKPEDLAANREGILTPEQDALVENIVQTRRRDARRTLIWMLAFYGALMVVGLMIEYNNQGENLATFFQKQGMIFLVVTLFFLAIILVSYFYSFWIERDARSRHIRIAEGEARVLIQEARSKATRYMRYELRIKRGMTRKLFRFGNERSIQFFEPGVSYRVYYIDYYPFQIVLSAEKI